MERFITKKILLKSVIAPAAELVAHLGIPAEVPVAMDHFEEQVVVNLDLEAVVDALEVAMDKCRESVSVDVELEAFVDSLEAAVDNGKDPVVVNSNPNHIPTTSNNKKYNRNHGRTYFCPFGADCVITKSHISQHVQRKHAGLLNQSAMIGGGSMSSIVQQIKAHTLQKISLASEKRNDDPTLIKCPRCDSLKPPKLIKEHMRKSHNVYATEANALLSNFERCLPESNEEKMSSLILEARTQRHLAKSVKEEDVLDEFYNYLLSFGGGSLAAVTANRRVADLRKLSSDLNLKLFNLIDEANRSQIDEKLQALANESFSRVNNAVTSLSSFNKFLSTCKMASLHAIEKVAQLDAFKPRIEAWLKSLRKCKNVYNSQLRNKLDDNVATSEEVQALQGYIAELKIICSTSATHDQRLKDLRMYLATSFSFESGNASRPDVPSNATLSEYKAWRHQLDAQQKKDGSVPHFRVHKHKTNQVYGAARVAVSIECAELLKEYGNHRLDSIAEAVNMHPYGLEKRIKGAYTDISPKLFDFGVPFSSIWGNVRKNTPALSLVTHTRFRYYIETMSRENLTVDDQRSVSHTLLHLPNVAAQSYQATTHSMAEMGSSLVQNIQIVDAERQQRPSPTTLPNAFEAGPSARKRPLSSVPKNKAVVDKRRKILQPLPTPQTLPASVGESRFGRQRFGVQKFV